VSIAALLLLLAWLAVFDGDSRGTSTLLPAAAPETRDHFGLELPADDSNPEDIRPEIVAGTVEDVVAVAAAPGTGTITGRLVDTAGEPVAQGTIWIWDE
jgi:hypothetical protein